eukprot:GHVH01017337.1.p1 GENE.GHVH01017337.1~~GHVH01017337.1.p1  ORF type:complete len:1018 (+),score=147.96 GHVH01017337.1:262-3315(+)
MGFKLHNDICSLWIMGFLDPGEFINEWRSSRELETSNKSRCAEIDEEIVHQLCRMKAKQRSVDIRDVYGDGLKYTRPSSSIVPRAIAGGASKGGDRSPFVASGIRFLNASIPQGHPDDGRRFDTCVQQTSFPSIFSNFSTSFKDWRLNRDINRSQDSTQENFLIAMAICNMINPFVESGTHAVNPPIHSTSTIDKRVPSTSSPESLHRSTSRKRTSFRRIGASFNMKHFEPALHHRRGSILFSMGYKERARDTDILEWQSSDLNRQEYISSSSLRSSRSGGVSYSPFEFHYRWRSYSRNAFIKRKRRGLTRDNHEERFVLMTYRRTKRVATSTSLWHDPPDFIGRLKYESPHEFDVPLAMVASSCGCVLTHREETSDTSKMVDGFDILANLPRASIFYRGGMRQYHVQMLNVQGFSDGTLCQSNPFYKSMGPQMNNSFYFVRELAEPQVQINHSHFKHRPSMSADGTINTNSFKHGTGNRDESGFTFVYRGDWNVLRDFIVNKQDIGGSDSDLRERRLQKLRAIHEGGESLEELDLEEREDLRLPVFDYGYDLMDVVDRVTPAVDTTHRKSCASSSAFKARYNISSIDAFVRDTRMRGLLPITFASRPVSAEEMRDIYRKMRYVKRSVGQEDSGSSKPSSRLNQVTSQFTDVINDYLSGMDILGIAVCNENVDEDLGTMCGLVGESETEAVLGSESRVTNFKKRWLLCKENLSTAMSYALYTDLLDSRDLVLWPEFIPKHYLPESSIVHTKYPSHHAYYKAQRCDLNVSNSSDGINKSFKVGLHPKLDGVTCQNGFDDSSSSSFTIDSYVRMSESVSGDVQVDDITSNAYIGPSTYIIHLARQILYQSDELMPLGINDVFLAIETLRKLPHLYVPVVDVVKSIDSLEHSMETLIRAQSELISKDLDPNVQRQNVVIIVTERMLDVLASLPELHRSFIRCLTIADVVVFSGLNPRQKSFMIHLACAHGEKVLALSSSQENTMTLTNAGRSLHSLTTVLLHRPSSGVAHSENCFLVPDR